MSLEKVRALMQEAGWGLLATSDGRKVGCRPMGGWAWMAGELWCATAKSSDKIAQLGSVPTDQLVDRASEQRLARAVQEAQLVILVEREQRHVDHCHHAGQEVRRLEGIQALVVEGLGQLVDLVQNETQRIIPIRGPAPE